MSNANQAELTHSISWVKILLRLDSERRGGNAPGGGSASPSLSSGSFARRADLRAVPPSASPAAPALRLPSGFTPVSSPVAC